eukprot:UN15975
MYWTKYNLEKFNTKLKLSLIDTVEKLMDLTDQRLVEMDIPKSALTEWRKKLPYTKSHGWQKTLYENGLGKYVLSFEENEIDN